MKKVLKIFLTAALALSVYFSSSLTVSAAGTSAKACVVMEAGSGRILYSKNPDERLPEASTTKIMTALVVAENVDADTVVRVPEQAQGVEGSSQDQRTCPDPRRYFYKYCLSEAADPIRCFGWMMRVDLIYEFPITCI